MRPCSSTATLVTVHSWHSSKICLLYTVRRHGTSNELCRCSRHRLTMNRRYSCIATFTICLSLVCRRLVFTAIVRPSTKDTCAVVLMWLELVGRLYTALCTRSNQDKCKCRYDRENLLLLLHSLCPPTPLSLESRNISFYQKPSATTLIIHVTFHRAAVRLNQTNSENPVNLLFLSSFSFSFFFH